MLNGKPVFVPSSGRKVSASTKARNEGTGVASILNPVNGYRDALARKGVKPKDHHRANVARLRNTQRANEQAKADAAAEAGKAKFKMARFANVPAKVTAFMPSVTASPKASAPPKSAGKTFLKSGAGVGAGAGAAAAAEEATAAATANGDAKTRRRSVSSKPAVPTAAELKAAAPAKSVDAEVDYVRANSRDVLKASAALTAAKAEAAAAPSAAFVDKSEFGKVPAYLLERKLAQAAEAEARRMASKANEGVPQGMTKLSEDERKATLSLLNEKQSELLHELSRVPMFVDTPSVVRRKTAIETQLKQIEDAINVFSRKVVYVKANAPGGSASS